MILAGDIGGTNTRLALLDEQLSIRHEQIAKNAEHRSLEEIVERFLSVYSDLRREVRCACFGVAGPVSGGNVRLTNLNWSLDEHELARALAIKQVALINDLVAHAEGVELLQPEQLQTLNIGEPVERGNRAVIAAGTGLGQAAMVWDSTLDGYRALACEGGHCDFAPRTPREVALAEYLQHLGKPLSWESVLSGPGLKTVYDFLCTPGQLGPQSALADAEVTPSKISAAAAVGTNPACAAAMEMFIGFYGAEAGNLALKLLTVGGVYLGGGIAPKIAQQLQSPVFLQRMQHKGPPNIEALLRRIPVFVIQNPSVGLLGAANHARRVC